MRTASQAQRQRRRPPLPSPDYSSPFSSFTRIVSHEYSWSFSFLSFLLAARPGCAPRRLRWRTAEGARVPRSPLRSRALRPRLRPSVRARLVACPRVVIRPKSCSLPPFLALLFLSNAKNPAEKKRYMLCAPRRKVPLLLVYTPFFVPPSLAFLETCLIPSDSAESYGRRRCLFCSCCLVFRMRRTA